MLAAYQMTCLSPENVVSFVWVKNSLAYTGGGLIVASCSWLFSLAAPTLVIAPAASQLKHLLQRGITEGTTSPQSPN